MSDTPTSSEGISNDAEVAPPPILQDHVVPAAPPLKPVGERDRILTLDVLRGFAIFGIIIVNIQWFAQPLMEAVQPAAEPSAADNACRMIVYTFFGSKFMTLFSLLFGMGLAVQSSRALAA